MQIPFVVFWERRDSELPLYFENLIEPLSFFIDFSNFAKRFILTWIYADHNSI